MWTSFQGSGKRFRRASSILYLFAVLLAIFLPGCTLHVHLLGTYYPSKPIKAADGAANDTDGILEAIHSGEYFNERNDRN